MNNVSASYVIVGQKQTRNGEVFKLFAMRFVIGSQSTIVFVGCETKNRGGALPRNIRTWLDEAKWDYQDPAQKNHRRAVDRLRAEMIANPVPKDGRCYTFLEDGAATPLLFQRPFKKHHQVQIWRIHHWVYLATKTRPAPVPELCTGQNTDNLQQLSVRYGVGCCGWHPHDFPAVSEANLRATMLPMHLVFNHRYHSSAPEFTAIMHDIYSQRRRFCNEKLGLPVAPIPDTQDAEFLFDKPEMYALVQRDAEAHSRREHGERGEDTHKQPLKQPELSLQAVNKAKRSLEFRILCPTDSEYDSDEYQEDYTERKAREHRRFAEIRQKETQQAAEEIARCALETDGDATLESYQERWTDYARGSGEYKPTEKEPEEPEDKDDEKDSSDDEEHEQYEEQEPIPRTDFDLDEADAEAQAEYKARLRDDPWTMQFEDMRREDDDEDPINNDEEQFKAKYASNTHLAEMCKQRGWTPPPGDEDDEDDEERPAKAPRVHKLYRCNAIARLAPPDSD